MNVLIPKLRNDGSSVLWKPLNTEEYLIYKFKSGNTEKMLCFENKIGNWDENLKSYMLNFNGRVTLPSVKNFQLMDPSNG